MLTGASASSSVFVRLPIGIIFLLCSKSVARPRINKTLKKLSVLTYCNMALALKFEDNVHGLVRNSFENKYYSNIYFSHIHLTAGSTQNNYTSVNSRYDNNLQSNGESQVTYKKKKKNCRYNLPQLWMHASRMIQESISYHYTE